MIALGVALASCSDDDDGANDPGDDVPLTPYPWPENGWTMADPADMHMNAALLAQARDYALVGGGAGMIIRYGRLVMSWGELETRWELKSTSKSVGSLLLALAIGDGLVSLDDPAQTHFPALGAQPLENLVTGWLDDVTLRDLANESSGFAKASGACPMLFEPGTAWLYSDCGADWLADVLTLRFQDDLQTVLRTRVLQPLEVGEGEVSWRQNIYREPTLEGFPRRELGSGMRASADALARIGYLILREGEWKGMQILPASFLAQMGTADPAIAAVPVQEPADFPNANAHYGLLWWTNTDGSLRDVPTDAFFSWGLFDSILLIIPSMDIVAVRVGEGWRAGWDADYRVVMPFIEPIAAAATDAEGVGRPR